MNFIRELFEDDNGRASMSRLLLFFSIFPASYVVVITQSGETLSWFLSAYAATYAGGKFSEAWKSKQPDTNVTQQAQGDNVVNKSS